MRRSVLWLLLALVPLPLFAQTPYPAKPLRIVVPFPAGGGTDVLARVFGVPQPPRCSRAAIRA